MKNMISLLITALLVFAMTGIVWADDLNHSPSIYLDYGMSDNAKFRYSMDDFSSGYDSKHINPISLGLECPFSNWKFGLNYTFSGNYNNISIDSTDEDIPISKRSQLLLGLGYRFLERENLQLYLDLVYSHNLAQYKFEDEFGYETVKFKTTSWLIGPELHYTFNEKLNLQAFLGYALYNSQKMKDEYNNHVYNYCAYDESMNLYKVKLNYILTNHWGISAGYSFSKIKSRIDFPSGSRSFKDTQEGLMLGVIYRF